MAHFGLRPLITFRTSVERVTPRQEGGYDVTTRNMESGSVQTRRYRAVLVCNGHHWQPKWPGFPGSFHGDQQHSHSYRLPEPYAGHNVLVVGIGNSGTDLACDIAPVAKQVYLSTRRSAHVIPRYIMGRPVDKWVTPANSRLPLPVTRLFYRLLLALAVGNQEAYGVPRPDHPILAEHPTMSAELLNLSALGQVQVKPDVAELCGDHVRFVDGSEEPIDSIIYATGYKISFPFFAEEFINVTENKVLLYRNVVDPDHRGLFFIGLIQPLGAIMPLAELQVQWVAGLLNGMIRLPQTAVMKREIDRAQRALKKRYVDSTRHTIQVDFYPYKRLLQREMARYGASGQTSGARPLLAPAAVGAAALSLAYLRRRRARHE